VPVEAFQFLAKQVLVSLVNFSIKKSYQSCLPS